MTRNALGRGLGALIREPEPQVAPPPAPAAVGTAVALEELARSINASGIIQPLVVRPIAGRFQLIAGERRWRAAQRAGLTKVSAIVRHVSDELALEMTLVENIQREDLNAIETARAFDRLMEEFHLTQEAVAE